MQHFIPVSLLPAGFFSSFDFAITRRSLAADNDYSSIEEEFSKSWEHKERLYGYFGANHDTFKKKILFLIAEMRERGYDRKLRAGIQLFDFILSRARIHGLREGQASLRFAPQLDGNITIQYDGSDGSSTLNVAHDEFTPELEALLERLLAHPID
jgi:hypothetical protein